MKVTAVKAIDVEFDTYVDMHDMMNEFSQRAEESTPDYWRRMLPAMDRMTRIMELISDETIASVQSEHKAIIAVRLKEQADRWVGVKDA